MYEKLFSDLRGSNWEETSESFVEVLTERGQEEDILSFAVCFERKHRETPIIFASRYRLGEKQEIFHILLRSSLLSFSAGRRHA